LPEFTGISSPYEEPEHADLTLRPEDGEVAAMVEKVWALLEEKGWLTV
jgi:adenylylsulfate kinase-like enzyme